MPQPTISQLKAAGSIDDVTDLLAIAVTGSAPDGSACQLPVSTGGASKGYQQLALAGVAAGLTIPAGATKALITPAVDIRWRDDGTDPTAGVGYPLKAGSELAYDLDRLASLRLFGTGNVDVFYFA